MAQILRAVEADAPRIRQLMELSVISLPSRDWFVDDDLPYILRHMEEEGYILKYLTDDQVLAGYVMVRWPGASPDNLGCYLDLPPEEYRSVAHIESTSVDPAFRGQKIFRSLLGAAIGKERDDPGIRYLMATVHPDNRYSKDILSEAGFISAAAVRKYGGLDRIVMYMPISKML